MNKEIRLLYPVLQLFSSNAQYYCIRGEQLIMITYLRSILFYIRYDRYYRQYNM